MIRESAAGVIRAAPRPWVARAAMSSPALPAKPLTSEAEVNTVRPVRNTRRRGQQVGDAAAEEQAAAGHQQVGGDEPLQVAAVQVEGRPMVGSAVLTTEMSRTTRIWAVRARASTAQDRRSVA